MAFWLFGTRVKIEFSFLLIIFLSAVTGSDNLLWLIAFSSLHEMGHIVALILLGGKADEITVSYYGIGMKHSAKLKPICEILFLFSGVAVNAIFALCNIHREINAALLFVNILPIYPLDGGRALDIIAELLFGADCAYKITTAVSFAATAVIFVCAAVFRNISLLMIGIYIVFYYINFRGIFNEKRS